MKNNVEIKQLMFIAKYYFNQAEKIEQSLNNKYLQMAVKDFEKECSEISSLEQIADPIILTAHLASSAFRLETIDGILNRKIYQNYNKTLRQNDTSQAKEFYNKNKNCIIHLLLRHKVGHPSKILTNRIAYRFYKEQYYQLTIFDLYNGILKSINEIEEEINNTQMCSTANNSN